MEQLTKLWEKLHDLIAAANTDRLVAFLDSLGAAETARAISRLSQEDQRRLFTSSGWAET